MLLISKNYWLGMPFNYLGPLPEGVAPEPVYLKADDMRESAGLFYAAASQVRQPKVAVLIMHPKVDFARHYCIPPFLRAGISCLGLNTRCLHNDINAIHEDLLLDVAAGVRFLKDVKGYEQVILFGNSGGGSLSAFYQAQAQLAPGERLETTPAGDATKLNRAQMIPADGLILVSAHRGEGVVLQEAIDPSVVEEQDPKSTNADLDMYCPVNGFKPAPEPSSYSDDFIQRYRAAQHERVQRLDELARTMVGEARHHEALYKQGKQSLSFEERQHHGRLAATEPVMVIYRTMANLHYTDPTLDPSSRAYGSLLSERPDLMNRQYMGFGRLCRPEAWLSTWSGVASNANLEKNLAKIRDIPLFFGYATKDKEIYPESDAKPLWNAVQLRDKTYQAYDAEHYFEPEFGAKTAPDVEQLMADVIPWVLARFGC